MRTIIDPPIATYIDKQQSVSTRKLEQVGKPFFNATKHLHTLMHMFHILLRVRKASRLPCTPNIQQQNDGGREEGMHRNLHLGQRLTFAPPLDISYATAQPRRIGANGKRGKRHRRWLPGRRDEGPMDENLDVVVCNMQCRRLAEMQEILATLVPAYCGRRCGKYYYLRRDVEFMGTDNDPEQYQSTC